MVQYSARFQSPRPKGRRIKMKMNRGKARRVMTADTSISSSRTRVVFGNLRSTGTGVLQ
jgi:hypothetical protein